MTVPDRVRAAIGRQLRQPSGFGGVLVGRLLAQANRTSNRIAIAALGAVEGDTVLELGCGPGRAIAALAKVAAKGRVLGIDHSAAMLKQAFHCNRSAIAAGRAGLVRGRFDALPFSAESIDRILAVHVVYFAEVSAIREARRVLRPSGRLVIVATDRAAMQRLGFDRLATHRLFDLDELAALLVQGGFAAEELSLSKVRLAPGVAGLLAIASKGNSVRA